MVAEEFRVAVFPVGSHVISVEGVEVRVRSLRLAPYPVPVFDMLFEGPRGVWALRDSRHSWSEEDWASIRERFGF